MFTRHPLLLALLGLGLWLAFVMLPYRDLVRLEEQLLPSGDNVVVFSQGDKAFQLASTMVKSLYAYWPLELLLWGFVCFMYNLFIYRQQSGPENYFSRFFVFFSVVFVGLFILYVYFVAYGIYLPIVQVTSIN
jgi:hypothetical protein